MRFNLSAHPSTPSESVTGVEVACEWVGRDRLWLRYFVDGPVDELSLPDEAQPERRDNLWQTTCFELFLRQLGSVPYVEFNFSPSSQWAAYGFGDVREGGHDLAVPANPEIAPLDAGDSYLAFEVEVTLPADHIQPEMLVALSAVIEEMDGTKTYWALHHPDPDKPDFHHPDCFTLELSPPEQA